MSDATTGAAPAGARPPARRRGRKPTPVAATVRLASSFRVTRVTAPDSAATSKPAAPPATTSPATTSPATTARPTTPAATSAATTARGAGSTRKLPVPQRSPELATMSLDRLRAYRHTLVDEELRASYWRRILQARRDLIRSGTRPGDRTGMARALTEKRGTGGRQMLLRLHPDAGMPILPNLPELWAADADPSNPEATARLYAKLISAENVLSSYREALHRRLDRATGDLVARYHEDPSRCLTILSNPPDLT